MDIESLLSKKKSLILAFAIICLGLMVTGGTYALLTFNTNTIFGAVNGNTSCFFVDYTTGSAITGTLFQSKTAKGGLYGSVSMSLSSSCAITKGTGTLKLIAFPNTSDVFFNGDKALKYAVYTSTTSSTPVSSGVINEKYKYITIYDGFDLTKTASTLYIYVWLDGTIADNDYIDAHFEGYIMASATQVE